MTNPKINKFKTKILFSFRKPSHRWKFESWKRKKPKIKLKKKTKMSGALRRNGSITRLLQKQPFTDPINRIHPFLRNQTQTQGREYFRFPNVLRKVREFEISPALFTSSSSSSSTASIWKVGFVGWYLGRVKSWPVLTKSVTSSLIYIAADLSSQVNFFFM